MKEPCRAREKEAGGWKGGRGGGEERFGEGADEEEEEEDDDVVECGKREGRRETSRTRGRNADPFKEDRRVIFSSYLIRRQDKNE